MRLNTGRFFSQLPGNPFPRSAGGWPSRDEVVRVLETFPERGGFKVQTGINIEKVEYDRQRDIWTISSQDGETFESRAVVVATGCACTPVIPKWEGMETFPGEIIHSSKFRNASAYEGKDVLVVGSGNSAAEIASRLAEYAKSVTLSARTPPHILPKSVFGIPLAGIGVVLRPLPPAWVDSFLHALRRLFIGDLTSYGLPFPESPVSQQFAKSQVVPIVYDSFAEDIRAGRIRVVGQIKKIEGQTVHAFNSIGAKPHEYPEETALNVDAIVAATGFRTGLTKLIQVPGITTEEDRPVAQGKHESPDAPRLYIIGHFVPLSGYLREIRLDAGRIARKIGKQLAASSTRGRPSPHQSMQIVEE